MTKDVPNLVLHLSEKNPTRGVVSPSVTCPMNKTYDATGVSATLLRKYNKKLNQQATTRSLIK